MSSAPPEFRDLTVETLRRAVDVYVAGAYPAGDLPEIARRRLGWPEGAALMDLLTGPLFERIRPPDGEGSTIYALRLGNHQYPHMKLQVQPWPTSIGYMLSVNTHDQILGLDPEAPGSDRFRALQAENQRLKEAIELAWDQNGFPTFLRYLRDYLDANTAAAQPGQGG